MLLSEDYYSYFMSHLMLKTLDSEDVNKINLIEKFI